MIWVVGSKGMLGRELCLALKNEGLSFYGSDKEVDILSLDALNLKAEKITPDWIVNCSAYTAVDKAEEEVDLAYKINRDGVRNLAVVAKKMDIHIIHISTDYVFDGSSNTPLAENVSTGPIGVYGKSKLAGEEILQAICDKVYILRTAWLYGQYGANFVYTMVKLMNKLDSIKVVDDQQGSPTWARDLANLIVTIIKSNKKEYGIYHFSNEGDCSWFDFAREIYQLGKIDNLVNSDCEIKSCLSEEFPTKAKRPAFSLLSKEKVKKIYSISVPWWQDSIKSFMKGINSNDII